MREQGETEHRLTWSICNPEYTVTKMEKQWKFRKNLLLDVTRQICNPEESRIEQQEQIELEDCANGSAVSKPAVPKSNDLDDQICNFRIRTANPNNTEYKNNNRDKHLSILYTVNHSRVQTDGWIETV